MVDQDIKDASNARDDYALQQSVIASLSQHALLGGTLQQLFDEATRLVRETLQASYATVMALRPDRETLVGKAGSGWEADVVRTIVAEVGARSDAGYAMLVNAPVIVTDFSSEQRLRSLIAKRWELQSGVTVVIHGREHPFGVLAIHDAQPRQFSHDEVDFLQSVANILGLAIGQRQTEEEVRASERYFRSLIEDTNDLIVVLDLEHRYQFVSASAERILGYRVEELVGRSTLDFCHAPDSVTRTGRGGWWSGAAAPRWTSKEHPAW